MSMSMSMSSPWTRMPGQTWSGTAVAFLGMWTVMMVVMMLPLLGPMLRGYRRIVRNTGATHLESLTALVGAGYFSVWAVVGAIVFPLGAAVTALREAIPSLARAAPIAVAFVVLLAGAWQLTPWKAERLASCHDEPGDGHLPAASARAAWRHGIRLGLECARCCGNLMAMLIVIGVMNVPAMLVVTTAVTLERLTPAGQRVARVTGVMAVAAGLLLMARSAGLG